MSTPDELIAEFLGDLLKQDWMVDAACRMGVSPVFPDAFFPEKGMQSENPQLVCRSCPVTTECLTYAVQRGIRDGMWGGVPSKKRQQMIQDKNAAAKRQHEHADVA